MRRSDRAVNGTITLLLKTSGDRISVSCVQLGVKVEGLTVADGLTGI